MSGSVKSVRGSALLAVALGALVASCRGQATTDDDPSPVAQASKDPLVEPREEPKGRAAPAPPSDVPTVKLAELLGAYKDNEVAADERFKGKWAKTIAYVDDIKKGFGGGMYTMLQDRKPGRMVFVLPALQASFDDEHKQALMELKKGDVVEVVCEIDGLLMHVQGDHCRILQSKRPTR